jgi:glutamate synthase domain-containing protein 3|tara:strand:- start:1043 stop:1885 length:843 start_codon:yes stop_codon:yes gene_type:complete
MAKLKQDKSHEMGLHQEQLKGKTQQRFFSIDESENLTYFQSNEVDTSKTATIDALDMTPREINREIRALMEKGVGDITVDNPMSRHGVGVGILNRLNLTFSDSLGYFGCGLIDGPNVHIKGRVGWSCAENMMAGTVVIDGNAGSTFGAAIRGGDLVCRGSVGARTGIDQKGGTIIVGGKTGAFSGFMMQRGRMIICGDAGMNLGDSMYDGTIYVGGEVEELGVDCVPGEMSELDVRYLSSKLDMYGIKTPNGVEKMNKYVSGKQLWNYDNLEPSEKKLVL